MQTTKGLVVAGRRRRLHSEEFKSKAVQACTQPGVSMAAAAPTKFPLPCWPLARARHTAPTCGLTRRRSATASRPWCTTFTRPIRRERLGVSRTRPTRRIRAQIPWTGSLVCNDFSGYKALFALDGTEAGCMAHARRKFVELHAASKSTLAHTALEIIGQLYAG